MIYSERGAGNIKTIILLTLVLIAVLVGFVLLLDVIGMMNAKEVFYPYFVKVPYVGKYFDSVPVTGNLLESEVLAKRAEALDVRATELQKKEQELKTYSELLQKRNIEVTEKEKDILAKEQAFIQARREEDDREKKLQRQAFYFENMKPVESARKLAELPDELVIEILKRIKEQKTVSVILMSMDDKKAADILRKMSR